MRSEMFHYIKDYYDFKLYTNNDVKIFVQVNWITGEEYKAITGADYVVNTI